MIKMNRIWFHFLFRPFKLFGQWLLVSRTRFTVFTTILLISGYSLNLISRANIGGHTWGIDFYNFYAYHHCEEFKNFPYKGMGEQCLDSRGMIYPPLMYWLYTWIRGLSYDTSYAIIIGLIVLGVLLSGFALPGESIKQRCKYLWLFPFLLFQFPSAYAIERGNNDIFIVLFWLGIMIAWYHKHYILAGLIAAAALQAKVYPVIPLGLLGLCWFYLLLKKGKSDHEFELKLQLNSFIIALIAGSILIFAVLWEQSVYYWFQVLPHWAKHVQLRGSTSHGIRSIAPSFPMVGIVAGGLLIFSWLNAIYRYLLKDPTLVLCGLLAISTYFQGVSNDYNLVTVYPLIALLFMRAFRDDISKILYAGLLPLFIFSGLGYKWFWGNHSYDVMGINIAVQVIWLSLIAFIPYSEVSIVYQAGNKETSKV